MEQEKISKSPEASTANAKCSNETKQSDTDKGVVQDENSYLLSFLENEGQERTPTLDDQARDLLQREMKVLVRKKNLAVTSFSKGIELLKKLKQPFQNFNN